MINVLEFFTRAQFAVQGRFARRSEEGFTTAELLGNAALGVVALVLIWKAMGALGLNVIDFIQEQITSGQ